jgi:SAM-dependent methyltransferase
MYDDLAAIYDRFIDWPARLGRELGPLTAWLGAARRVADVACGSGGHSLALARAGYRVTGFDPSVAMLGRAESQRGELPATFVPAAFGQLAERAGEPFEAAICLGNSICHLTRRAELEQAVADLRRLLVPGGRLLLGLRNLTRAAAAGERWLPLKACCDPDGTEWVFQRRYDYRPGSLVDFTFVALWRAPGQPWRQQAESTRLRAWPLATWREVFGDWSEMSAAGSLNGEPFDEPASGDLFLTAQA